MCRVEPREKKAPYSRVNVFSTNVLIRHTIFTSPTGDGTAILRGHPSHAKVQPPAGQRKYLHFSVILRPWVLVRPRESNRRPLALHSHALPTELTLPRLKLAWENSRLSRRQYCFRHKMTSEKRAQKFHTGYLLLPRSGNASDLLKQICLTARPIRSNTQITTHNPLNHSN